MPTPYPPQNEPCLACAATEITEPPQALLQQLPLRHFNHRGRKGGTQFTLPLPPLLYFQETLKM